MWVIRDVYDHWHTVKTPKAIIYWSIDLTIVNKLLNQYSRRNIEIVIFATGPLISLLEPDLERFGYFLSVSLSIDKNVITGPMVCFDNNDFEYLAQIIFEEEAHFSVQKARERFRTCYQRFREK